MIGYSNYDHTWDEGAREKVEAGEKVEHFAWEHYGQIWKDGDEYVEEVRQYHFVVATVRAPTLDDLVREVNSRYGRG